MIDKMNIKNFKTPLFTIIKIISIPLITSGIGLELWNIQTLTTKSQIPALLNPVLLLAHIALSAHFLESIIAAYYAPSKNKMPLQYAVYTFFVGTVGLLELFNNHEEKG
jgi:hypothetical protein